MNHKSKDLIVWSRTGGRIRLAARCGKCGGEGRFFAANVESEDCQHCKGCGWFGIDPKVPVEALPGSVEKVAALSVRYASGLPLWNRNDGFDPEAARRAALLNGENVARNRGVFASLFDEGQFEDFDSLPLTLSP
jgi:hypothetical protein